MHPTVPRLQSQAVERDLAQFPVVALVGPRQCGKTTLARAVAERIRASGRGALWLDLERPSDIAKLQDPELFLRRHAPDVVCLDEVQRLPRIFEVLRALVDEDRRPGRFLLLGSASPALLQQSSESLAGRIALHELTPLLHTEVVPDLYASTEALWLRGGFPDSLLAANDDASLRWREQFIRTFLERDVPQLGFRVPAQTLDRFWRMCAHLQGELLNLTALGRSMGTSHPTVRHYVDMFVDTYVLRTLPPFEANLGKRLVKSPKVYLRDSGILHALLDIDTLDTLSGHPVYGASWEGFVIEQILSSVSGFRGFHYRTTKGDEIDLVLEKRGRRIAIECKASSAPTVTRGFHTALEDLGIHEGYVVAQVRESYPIAKGVEVVSLAEVLTRLKSGRLNP